MSLFRQHAAPCAFPADESWVILSPIEASIKRKIEAVGTPLSEWDISINYGIKTGCNEAFIISTARRDEILAACRDEAERERTAELIRPILRGRDIKRYGYEWAELWIIGTHNGVRGKFPPIDIEEYPAVKAHLDQYWDKIAVRDDQGATPYNLRNCAYWEDFEQPKIIFQEIVQGSQFFLDSAGEFLCNDTCRIIVGEHLSFLLLVLNNPLFYYAVKNFYGGGGLGDHGVRMKHTFFVSFPCLPYNEKLELMAGHNNIEDIDQEICRLYGLTEEETREVLESMRNC